MFELLVPDHQASLAADAAAKALWDGAKGAWEESPDAYVTEIVAHCRGSLGVAGRDFLVVAVQVNHGQCTSCHYVVFGVVDLSSRRYVGAIQDHGTTDERMAIKIADHDRKSRMTFEYDYPDCGNSSHCVHYSVDASLEGGAAGAASVTFAKPKGTPLK